MDIPEPSELIHGPEIDIPEDDVVFDPAPERSSELPANTHELLQGMLGDSLLVFSDKEDGGTEPDDNND
ncbi:hypothetical protein E1B28_002907 [Marasmius oreades]|uniref:Uncharacterized protein n=1 Tax=Marasmius oreades TaxID=181124 RepID=A0A9P7RLA9_9AGAR|nr:uncharacterized protein E1B28_002907 [Marasmius oreades]KAG7085341.1 hypothetical protein E1B28_002907 [Marasmius oreades]